MMKTERSSLSKILTLNAKVAQKWNLFVYINQILNFETQRFPGRSESNFNTVRDIVESNFNAVQDIVESKFSFLSFNSTFETFFEK